MGQRISSCISSGVWRNTPNDPIVDDQEVTHFPELSSQIVDVEQTLEATYSGKLCDFYLKRTIQCLNQARKMTSGSSEHGKAKLNRSQCEYLVKGLEIAVGDTRKSFPHSSHEHEVECLEALKFLHRLAKEVESFIQMCCCNDKTWFQAALTSTSVAVRVSSIGYYLKLCTMLLCDWNKLGAAWPTFSELKLKCPWEAELLAVRDRALLDKEALLRLLECDPTLLSKSMATEVQMANILRNRMKSTQREELLTLEDLDNFWEIDRGFVTRSELLGQGIFAVVYKAKWLGVIEVAEKVSSGVFEQECKEEALSLAKLSHPNIVSLFGITIDKGDKGDKRDSFSIVMELMDADLRTLIQQRMQHDSTLTSPFNIYETCDLMLQIAEGVHYMHENEVVHRDLKGANIYVSISKEDDKNKFVCAKVGGLGFSKMNQRSSCLSPPKANVGTKLWMPPKSYAPDDNANYERYPQKSDVYSFGMVCYEILTGALPFDSLGVAKKVLVGVRPLLPPHCPTNLKNLIELCWNPMPTTRPSFAEICEELRYIKCSLLLEPIDHNLQIALPIPKPLELPAEVSKFKVDYSSLKVVKLLAKGGSDAVTLYVTSWQKKGTKKKDVAQKTFLGACNKSFVNEVSILAGLKNDNIIRLLCSAADRRSCSVVMDLMDGDLCYFISKRKQSLKDNSTCTFLFSMSEALYIMVQIAQGMQYIHGKRIVHRDLKSMNILVKARGRTWDDVEEWDVKVADFEFSEKMDNRAVLNKAFAVGTIRWTAPEIVQEVMYHVDNALGGPSNYEYDPFKCDVYSFGMVCYEILTGNVPFHDIEDLEEVKEKILEGRHVPLSLPKGTSPNLRDLVEKCWLKETNKRPSFVEIVEVLKRDQRV